MSQEIRVLLPSDKPAILGYAQARLRSHIQDEMEREMQSWSARWRGEALDHYLPQGWSYGVVTGGELVGFLLAQPILYYRGLTQTLWIEDLQTNSDETAELLLDTAYRWARDKHFQTLLLETDFAKRASQFKVIPLADGMVEIRTARF